MLARRARALASAGAARERAEDIDARARRARARPARRARHATKTRQNATSSRGTNASSESSSIAARPFCESVAGTRAAEATTIIAASAARKAKSEQPRRAVADLRARGVRNEADAAEYVERDEGDDDERHPRAAAFPAAREP